MNKNIIQPAMKRIGNMLAILPEDLAKGIVDDVLDVIENRIKKSKVKWDDYLVQPAIDYLRKVAGIPDDINGDKD